MNVSEYLQGARQSYVEWFRSALRSKREEGVECHPEIWLQPNLGAGDQRPPHPLCVDIMIRQNDQPSMVMMMRGSEIAPLTGTMYVRDVPIRVYAPAWEDFAVWAKLRDPDWAALDPWRKKWMNPEAAQSADEDGLTGVVHYTGSPVAEGGGYLHQMDFGTAPLEALMELLNALVDMGAGEIELGQSDGSDLPADVLAELRQPDLPLGKLASLAQRVLSGLDEVERVEQASPEELLVYRKGEKNPYRAYLNNLHRLLQRTGVEARSLEFYRFLRGQRELLSPDSTAPDLSQLRLVIKDDRFLQHVEQRAPGLKGLLKRKLVADIWSVCVWDAPNGMRFANIEEPEKYGLSPDEVLDRALKNFLENRPTVELSRQGALFIAQTRDSYDSSLLLDDRWWDEMASKVQGELLACVPARHVVLIGGAARPQTVEEMCQAAQRIEAGGDHLVTDTILVRRNGKWEEFRPISEAPPATASPSRPRRPK
ncbi:MAG TPA: DUF1444 family protein [Tepidisphaeraceae bacterium]|nr:DUF1444 family protein [Tepidisphaeraceae bacterium]